MRLLLIEDSRRLRESLSVALRRLGYTVDSAGDGEEGLRLARRAGYEVIILDLMLPGIDGMTILTRLRSEKSKVAVLILTARDAVQDRVAGLKAGADDYLLKPFSLDELDARLQVLVRRLHQLPASVIALGSDLLLDLGKRRLFRDGVDVILTHREFALLEFLALRRGQLVNRRQIEETLYDGKTETSSNAVDSAVCVLRRKIDAPGHPSLIQTRRGLGYVLISNNRQGESGE